MQKSLMNIKPTVNAADLAQQEKFTADFGEDG